MDSNRGTFQLKLSETKWIKTLETVMDISGKDDPPARNKLPEEVDIPEWLCTKVL